MRRALALLLLVAAAPCAAAPLVAYDDALQNGFQDWSWAVHDLAATSPVRAGTRSISCELDAWAGVYLHLDAGVDVAAYDGLEFSVHGGAAGGQLFTISFISGGTTLQTVDMATYLPGGVAPAGTWADVRIPFDSVGLAGQVFDGFYFQDATGGNQATLWLDEIRITERAVGPPTPITVTVSPALDRHPISPLVYGVNFGDPSDASEPPYPLRRWGGNSVTRYSWEDDVHNSASDWFFVNYTNGPDPGTLPDGSSADVFIGGTRAEGADVILTVPTIGWTPIDRTRRWGFSVATYGPQQQTECDASGGAPWCNPDMGNGVTPGGVPIVGNDPTDTSRPIDPTFVTRWMAHVAGREGTAASGGVRYYGLDNEPMLWSSSHRDVHPAALGYTELWQKTLDYARAVRAQDPAAQVLGPDSWGWCDYFWSDADGCGNSSGADYRANGPLLAWYLRQVEAERLSSGQRLVDVLDIHYYPQAADVALTDDEGAAASARRLRSTRGLWDPTYVDESWVGSPVELVPRMKALIAANCPGTKFALTEYNWGNDDGLSSALAEVDVLGILGREDVDIATRWVAPAAGTRVEDAFRLFLDYDRAGSAVTGDSVRAVSSDGNAVSSFGVRAADDTLYVVLVNKDTRARDVSVDAGAPLAGAASLFGFDGATRLAAFGSVAVTGSSFSLTMPARSTRLAVARISCPIPGVASDLRVTKSPDDATITFAWADAPSATDHVLHEDAVASGGFVTQAGSAMSGSAPGLTLPMPAGARVFYLVAGRNACGEGPLR